MYEEIKKALCEQHGKVIARDIDFLGRGLISLRDAGSGCYVIKGKHANGASLTVDDILVLNEEGDVLEGGVGEFDDRFYLHLAVYKKFPSVRSVATLDSRWCGVWAQLGWKLPPLSALHASFFFGEIPCTPNLIWTKEKRNIYAALGDAVDRTIGDHTEGRCWAVFIRKIGALVWGDTVSRAADNAMALEEIVFRALMYKMAGREEWEYMQYRLSKYFYFEADDEDQACFSDDGRHKVN